MSVAVVLRPVPQPSPVWNRRLTEWGLIALLVIALAAVLARQVREVRGQAELAHIKSTLGALRTALVLAHLETAAASRPGGSQVVAPVQRNPFAALRPPLANYVGLADPQALALMPGGRWVFDPDCGCVGYRPAEAALLESPQDAVALWFRVGASTGPTQITALQPYVWMGQFVD